MYNKYCKISRVSFLKSKEDFLSVRSSVKIRHKKQDVSSDFEIRGGMKCSGGICISLPAFGITLLLACHVSKPGKGLRGCPGKHWSTQFYQH